MRPFDFSDLEFMATRFTPLETYNEFLDGRYDWQKTSNGVEWPYYRFFYHLSKMLQPDIILELGGWQGTAAAHFAAGWEKSIVLTVDHHTDLGDDKHQEKMFEAQREFPNTMVNKYPALEYRMVYLQGWTTPKLAFENRGKHLLGDAESVYEKVIDHTLYYGKKIDILFIDSWHVYKYAKMDWETYKPLLNSPALVICDDVIEGADPGNPISGMMQFWDEMPDPKFLNGTLHPGSRMGFVLHE